MVADEEGAGEERAEAGFVGVCDGGGVGGGVGGECGGAAGCRGKEGDGVIGGGGRFVVEEGEGVAGEEVELVGGRCDDVGQDVAEQLCW